MNHFRIDGLELGRFRSGVLGGSDFFRELRFRLHNGSRRFLQRRRRPGYDLRRGRGLRGRGSTGLTSDENRAGDRGYGNHDGDDDPRQKGLFFFVEIGINPLPDGRGSVEGFAQPRCRTLTVREDAPAGSTRPRTPMQNPRRMQSDRRAIWRRRARTSGPSRSKRRPTQGVRRRSWREG